MSKRHNRKRTRSRPRHRDGSNFQKNHTRSTSVDTNSSVSTITPSSYHYPGATLSADHWHQTYYTWQNRLRLENEQVQEREREVEMQRLRIFGGEPGDEVSLLEPMLKVVTDLFDGFTDYEDP